MGRPRRDLFSSFSMILEVIEFIFDLYLGIFIHIGKIIQGDELLNEI